MKEMDKTLADLKKLVEKQKIAEEQERLRKMQVRLAWRKCHNGLTGPDKKKKNTRSPWTLTSMVAFWCAGVQGIWS